MSSSRFSLFFVKKRAFKIFNKESKQDSYSTKQLLEKSFPTLNLIKYEKNISQVINFSNKNHWIFWTDSFSASNSNMYSLYNNICVHCGLSIINCMHNI